VIFVFQQFGRTTNYDGTHENILPLVTYIRAHERNNNMNNNRHFRACISRWNAYALTTSGRKYNFIVIHLTVRYIRIYRFTHNATSVLLPPLKSTRPQCVRYKRIIILYCRRRVLYIYVL